MKTYEVCVRHGWSGVSQLTRLSFEKVEASDLAAAVAGYYAMHGPASGGTLTLDQIVSVVEVEKGEKP